MLGRPVAVAPEPGGPQIVGEASGAAEAFGVRAGMRLAEALSRCPALALVAADPVRAEAVWERSLRRLEGLGATVEPARPGEAFFALEPLCGLYGSIAAVLARARRALGPPARLGAGPNRLCAHAAATRMRARRPAVIVTEPAARRLLAGLPVAALRDRLGDERRRGWEEAAFIDSLERLGVRTLGELAALPAEAVADRFGEPGLRALRLARGVDEPLRPRRPTRSWSSGSGCPRRPRDSSSSALGLLIERLLAHPARAGRTIRRLRLEARLAAGAAGARGRAARRAREPRAAAAGLTPRLGELPGPATSSPCARSSSAPRPAIRRRCGAHLRGTPWPARRGGAPARAAAGRDAILQVIEVDPRSRVPERRAILTPFPDGADG